MKFSSSIGLLLLCFPAKKAAAECMGWEQNSLDFSAASRRWSENKPTCYKYTITRACPTCEAGDLWMGPFEVVVNNGHIVSPEPGGYRRPSSIDNIFSFLERDCLDDCPNSGPSQCVVTYAGNLGYPMDVKIDFNDQIQNEELEYTISDFEELDCQDAGLADTQCTLKLGRDWCQHDLECCSQSCVLNRRRGQYECVGDLIPKHMLRSPEPEQCVVSSGQGRQRESSGQGRQRDPFEPCRAHGQCCSGFCVQTNATNSYCSGLMQYQYQGCFENTNVAEVMTLIDPIAVPLQEDSRSRASAPTVFTPDTCAQVCEGVSEFGGLSQGGECYCGNIMPDRRVNDRFCSTPCTEDQNYICGGETTTSVFRKVY